jgi:hypothetical protein
MAKYIISGPMVSIIRKASQHIMSKVATQDAPQYPCSHHFMVAFIFICQRKRGKGKGKGRKAILCTKLKSVVTQIQKIIGASCVTTENAASAYCLQLVNYYVMSAIFFQAYQIWQIHVNHLEASPHKKKNNTTDKDESNWCIGMIHTWCDKLQEG